MFNPLQFYGTTSPVPEALLSIPPTYAQLGAANAQYGQGSLAGSVGAQQPWNPKVSITPWVVVGLLIALWGIHTLYFKDKRKAV